MSRCLFLCFASSLLALASSPAAAENDEQESVLERSRALVAQLGDDEFAVRERATDELVKLGLAALPALEEGRKLADREIRYRCRRIDALVRENDFQRRLEAFARNQDEGESYDLPGWSRFEKLLGTGAESRALFVEIQKEETEALKSFGQGPKAVAATLEIRAQQLNQARQIFRSEVSLGSVAAMLFMAADEEVALSAQASSSLYTLCYQTSFRTAMTGGPHQPLLRKLLGTWIQRASGWSSYQAMSLALMYEMEDGLVPATRELANMGAQTHIRQYAILTIGKLGGAEHLPLLEGLLNDETQTSQRTLNKVKYTTQIRDVALATLLYMNKQDPKKFGFDRIQPNSRMLFSTSSIGFKDEKQRQAAFDKWKKFRASNTADEE